MSDELLPLQLARREAEREGVMVFVCYGKPVKADDYDPRPRREGGHGYIDAVGFPVGWRYVPGRHE